MASLQNKITKGYRMLVIGIVFLGLIAFLDLLFLDVFVEGLPEQKQTLLNNAIEKSQWVLLTFICLIGLLIYIAGYKLKRDVVLPLQRLEENLKKISQEPFTRLVSPSDDEEFTRLTKVFNHLLKEIEMRQKHMLQTNKLASLGVLATGVAHELNNPLSNISTSCQLIMEETGDVQDEQINQWLKQIDQETERGRNIVRTLLDFGQQGVFEKKQLKFLDLINETRFMINKPLSEYAAELQVNVSEKILLNVDKQRIQQLFINLLQNALQAGGKGTHITITATNRSGGRSMLAVDAEVVGNLANLMNSQARFVEILVTDDGPGIKQEMISKVFDPFYTTSQPGKGVGLGLYIVQEIIKNMTGVWRFHQSPG